MLKVNLIGLSALVLTLAATAPSLADDKDGKETTQQTEPSRTITGPMGRSWGVTGLGSRPAAQGGAYRNTLGGSGAWSSEATGDGGRATQGQRRTFLGGEAVGQRVTGPDGVQSQGARRNFLGGEGAYTREAGSDGVATKAERRTFLGGRHQVERKASGNGVQSSISGTTFLGGSYSCNRGAQYGNGGRSGGLTCTGPGGRTFGSASVTKTNPDGSVDITLQTASGVPFTITAKPQ